MTYLISIPLIKRAQINAAGQNGNIFQTHNLINEIKQPKTITNFILPYEPFSENLKTQLALWKQFLQQNPRVAKLAEAFTNVYTEVNSENGFRLKLSDSFSLLLKPQGQIAVSIEDGYQPVESTLQETVSKHLETAKAVIFLRELRASNLLSALQGKEHDLEFKSLVTQVSKTPTAIQPEWLELSTEIKQISQELNSTELLKAIPWISQVVSSIPPNSPQFEDSAHLIFLRQLGILNKDGSLNLPNDEQLQNLRPAISSFFIGLLKGPNMSNSPNYPSNFHSVAVPGNLNERFKYIPTGLTAVNFRGETTVNSEEQDTKIWTNDQLQFQIKALPVQEFASALLKDKPQDIASALKSIPLQNPVDKNIVHTIANLFQKQNPSQEQIQTILTKLASQKPHLLQPVIEAIYLGKKAQALSLEDAQKRIDVSHLTDTANSILKDLGEYTFSIQYSEALNLAAKLTGTALKNKPSDIQAQYLMAKIQLKQGNFEIAYKLASQTIEKSSSLSNQTIAELHLLRAYAAMNLACMSTKQQKNLQHLSSLLLKVESHNGHLESARRDLKQAFTIDPELRDKIGRETSELLTNELNFAQQAQVEGLLHLLICAEPTNIKLYADLIDLYQNKYKYRDPASFKINTHLALLRLLDKGITYSGPHPSRQELLRSLVKSCEKSNKWNLLKNFFDKDPVSYIQELFPKAEDQAQLFLSLALASEKSNKILPSTTDTKSFLEKVQNLKPDLVEELKDAVSKALKNEFVSKEDYVTAAKYRLFFEPTSEEAYQADCIIYNFYVETNSTIKAHEHLEMLCKLHSYPKVINTLIEVIVKNKLKNKARYLCKESFDKLLTAAPEEQIQKLEKQTYYASIANKLYDIATLRTPLKLSLVECIEILQSSRAYYSFAQENAQYNEVSVSQSVTDGLRKCKQQIQELKRQKEEIKK